MDASLLATVNAAHAKIQAASTQEEAARIQGEETGAIHEAAFDAGWSAQDVAWATGVLSDSFLAWQPKTGTQVGDRSDASFKVDPAIVDQVTQKNSVQIVGDQYVNSLFAVSRPTGKAIRPENVPTFNLGRVAFAAGAFTLAAGALLFLRTLFSGGRSGW